MTATGAATDTALPRGLPVPTRLALAVICFAVAVAGPSFVVAWRMVLTERADAAANRAQLQRDGVTDLPAGPSGSVWHAALHQYAGLVLAVAVWLVVCVLVAAFLWRRAGLWRRVAMVLVTVEVLPYLVAVPIFDATTAGIGESPLVPVAVAVGLWLGAYLVAGLAVRVMTWPGQLLARSGLEMILALRGRPVRGGYEIGGHRGRIRIQRDQVRVDGGLRAASTSLAISGLTAVRAGRLRSDGVQRVGPLDSRYPERRSAIALPAGPAVALTGAEGRVVVPVDERTVPLLVAAVQERAQWRRGRAGEPPIGSGQARHDYAAGKELLKRNWNAPVTGPPALVGATVLLGLLTVISLVSGVHDGLTRHQLGKGVLFGLLGAAFFGVFAAVAAHDLYAFLRGKRYLETHRRRLPDSPGVDFVALSQPPR